jgi:hypothetical protein
VANETLTRKRLKTPNAAAIAGLLFSLLLMAAFALLRISVPADPQEPGSWLRTNSQTIALATNLVPFAGIAFLWFIGVLRDRLGELEDRFFATVFFGSGLLFLSMLFLASSFVGWSTNSFCHQTGRNDRLGDVSIRSSRDLCDDKRLHGQDGRRFHDHDVDDRSLYRDCTAVAGGFRICTGTAATIRQLLYQLEFCCFSLLGLSVERLHSR